MRTNIQYYLDMDCQLDEDDNIFLPIFHNCILDECIFYLTNTRIIGKRCNVFKENLIYTFYGVSKFKKQGDLKLPRGKKTVCFALNLVKCCTPHRIYPFDSGNLAGSRNGINKSEYWDVIKETLNLGSDRYRIKKLINIFFRRLEDYLKGKPAEDYLNSDKNISSKITALDSFKSILLEETSGDNRKYCFEVQFKDEIELNPSIIELLIVPRDLLSVIDTEPFKKFKITERNVKFYPTDLQTRTDIDKKIEEISFNYVVEKYIEIKVK